MTNVDFDLKLSAPKGYEAELIGSPFGRSDSQELLLPENLDAQLQLFESGRATRREINALGTALSASLLSGQIGKIWERCKGNPDYSVVRLRLDIRSNELRNIPWELMRDGEVYLALADKFPIVRFEQHFSGTPTQLSSPLKILLVAATPVDAPPLPGVKREIHILTEVLGTALRSSVSKVEVVESTTYEKFTTVLADKFDVVHFMGHGAFRNNRGYLLFEDQYKNADWCEAESIGDLVFNHTVFLMILNACETAISSSDDTLLGVASAIHRKGVPSVVAMQQVIQDQIAPIFAQKFYETLIRGNSLEKCMTDARLTAKNAQGNDGIEWSIPALFSNTPLAVSARSKPLRPTTNVIRTKEVKNSIVAIQGDNSVINQRNG
jgi:hypothetical protein